LTVTCSGVYITEHRSEMEAQIHCDSPAGPRPRARGKTWKQ
jgi:hypothetical protein